MNVAHGQIVFKAPHCRGMKRDLLGWYERMEDRSSVRNRITMSEPAKAVT
jgi:hypothetical protein